MDELAEQVLAGIFPDRLDRLRLLARSTTPDHFPKRLSRMYELVRRYYAVAGGVITPKAFVQALEGSGAEAAVIEAEKRLFLKLWQMEKVDDPKWKWALHGLREERQGEALVETLTTAMRIMTEGVQERRGERLFGFRSARAYLGQRLGEIDRLALEGDSVEGNIMEEADVVLADYKERSTKGVHRGVMTGFEALDNLTYGAQRGEFWMVAAYAGEGKTQALTNMAYQAVMDGHNVVFFTLETLRDQVRRRFVTRHANHEKFGVGEGLRYSDLKGGRLDEEDEDRFTKVAEDLKDWRAQGYGRLEVVWAPRGSTVDSITTKAEVYASMFDVGLIVVDYAGLMRSSDKRLLRQESLIDVLQSLKGLATAYNDGTGVPVISAYQTTRQRRDDARRSGEYTLDSLAETAEAERSTDLVMSLLRLEDESREVQAQVLKYRDGGTLAWTIEADFERSLMRDQGEVSDSFGGSLLE